MDRVTNIFKARLQAGDVMHGLWFGLANNIAAEICAQSGFDWLMIDAEHSPLSDKDILGCLQALAPYDIQPLVRPVSGDKNILKRLCDIGVQSFLIPMVDDAEQAEAIMSAVQYPPSGTRGLGTSMARAARWNMTSNYFTRANEEMCVVLQIETLEGLKNLHSIAAVDGVDAIFIGPSDLGAALGYPGDPMNPAVVDVVSQALKDITSAGKRSGVLAVDPKLVEHYISCGASFIGVGSDCGVLAKGVQKLYENFAQGGTEKGDY